MHLDRETLKTDAPLIRTQVPLLGKHRGVLFQHVPAFHPSQNAKSHLALLKLFPHRGYGRAYKDIMLGVREMDGKVVRRSKGRSDGGVVLAVDSVHMDNYF